MHTKLNIPVIFNLFPKVSIPLEQIHASKQVFKAELTVPYFSGTLDVSINSMLFPITAP